MKYLMMIALIQGCASLPAPQWDSLDACYDDAATTTEQCDGLQDAGVL